MLTIYEVSKVVSNMGHGLCKPPACVNEGVPTPYCVALILHLHRLSLASGATVEEDGTAHGNDRTRTYR